MSVTPQCSLSYLFAKLLGLTISRSPFWDICTELHLFQWSNTSLCVRYKLSECSDKKNKKHKAYKIIKKYLKKAGNEKQLKKKLKKLKEDKVAKAMQDISEYGRKYLESSWIGNPEVGQGYEISKVLHVHE